MPIISSKDFTDTILGYLDELGDEAVEANETALRSVAKDVTKDLKKAGSFGGSGAYRKSIVSEIKKTRVGVSAEIGAGRYGGLTHLLEFGHAKKNGGRTTAFNFVAPINDSVEERYVKKMEELLNK